MSWLQSFTLCMNRKQYIIALSYAKRALEAESRERARLRRYAEHLREYHVIVFTSATDGFPAVQQDGNLYLYATNSRSKLGRVARAFALGREILAQHPSEQFCIDSQDPFETSFIARLLCYNTAHRHQVQIHGDVFNPRARQGWFGLLRVWYARRVVRQARCIRVVSERIKRSVLALGVKEQSIHVLPIYADLDPLLATGATRAVTAGDPLRLIFIGRFTAEKNIPLLLRSVADLRQAHIPVTLRLVGAGSEQTSMERLIAQLELRDVVTVTAWNEDLPALLATADALCLTSWHEGWAMVLQEAAAAALPVVTTDVGCAGELLKDTEHGLIVPVGDETAYVAALRRMTDNALRARLGRAAHQRVAATYRTEGTYVQDWIATHCID